MMAKIVAETEMQIRADAQRYPYHVNRGLSIPETICESMAHSAEDLDLAAIAVFTESGTTARLLSKYHPVPAIFALSSVEKTIRRMSLLWGVNPVQCQKMQNTDQMVNTAERLLAESGRVQDGQILGIVAGTRTKTGSTNFLRLHMVGDGENSARRYMGSAKPKKRAKPTRQAASTAHAAPNLKK